MFKFKEYKISFRHIHADRKVMETINQVAPPEARVPYAEATVCIITMEGALAPIASGVARCSLKDQFSREKGRELAFARALQELIPSDQKDARREFWKAFWTS